MITSKKIIIGLAGEMACGKGTIAKYIEDKYKGVNLRFSTMLRDVLGRLYLEESRENMQNLSTVLRQHFGQDILAKVMSKEAESGESDIIAIDGIRRPEDMKFLKELPGFVFVYIDAGVEVRYRRIVERGENHGDNTKTLEQFKKDLEGEADIQIKGLKNLANYVVNNDGDMDSLYAQIDEIISKNQVAVLKADTAKIA